MKIVFRKRFLKQFHRLPKRQRHAVADAIDAFRMNPTDARLNNHALEGPMLGKRSLSAGFDLRIIFVVEGDYVTVIMLAVGKHNRVYK